MSRRIIISLALLGCAFAASDPFSKKLSHDLQITHALNRLTFGARPGDAEAVKKLGLAKWIDRQLHPGSLGENPQLDEKPVSPKTITLSASEARPKPQGNCPAD